MAQTVIVAEKPSVARDIARVIGAKERKEGYFVGAGYAVTWALGHLYGLANPDEIDPKWGKWRADLLPMLPDEIPLKALPKTRERLGVIRKLLRDKETTHVICATDAGREGELIFRRIAMEMKLDKPVSRLWISSMTDEAIKEGFASLRPSAQYDTLYECARCRAQADWLVGMNGSRAYTVRFNALLSVGRVQTPTLGVVVRRHHEILAFVPEAYCEVEADFGDYKGLWTDAQGKGRIAQIEAAKAIVSAVKGKPARVAESQKQRKHTPPPLLYDLTLLQREANKKAGLTADQTLKAAQSLYEKHKVLTYPRTDSNYLPDDMASGVAQALGALSGPYAHLKALLPEELPHTTRVFNDKKVTDHHAIIPTKKQPSALSAQEQVVYDLVVRRTVAVFLSDYVYDSMRVVTRSEGHNFLSRGSSPVEQGWRAAYGGEMDEVGEKREKEAPLPALSVGMTRKVEKVRTIKKSTKPPAQHTEATLLSAMENAGKQSDDESLREAMKESGLGTPATRAAIIERLLAVGYMQRKGRALLATDKGVALIDVVPPELSSAETTGKWEKGLTRIRQGKMEPEKFMHSIRKFAAYLCEAAAKDERSSPFPKEERRKKGAVRAAAPKAAAPKGAAPKAAAPKAQAAKARAVRGTACPLCGGQVLQTQKAFGCANWKEKGCRFALWKNAGEKAGGPLIDRAMAVELIAKGRVSTPTGGYVLKGGRAYYTGGGAKA